jgi:N-acyl-D-amino-acid deacylase
MFDLVLENGLIIDGTGAPAYKGNIFIKNGKIAHISDIESPNFNRKIDVQGLVVSPGFIDGHTHAEGYTIGEGEPFIGKIFQGVTTEIMGNCGISVFPLVTGYENDLKAYFKPFTGPYQIKWDWNGVKTLSERIKPHQLMLNIGTLVGHGSLRIAVMGFENRVPSPKELEKMIALLKTAFDEGAVGLSLGLIYPPGVYAGLNELVHLSRVAASYNRPVTIHLRSETFHLVESVKEMIKLSNKSGAHIVISHHKAIGKNNWSQLTESLRLIENANAINHKIHIDIYPYVAANTTLRSLLPPWALYGGIDGMLELLRNQKSRENIQNWIERRKDWENLGLAAGWDAVMISSSSHCQEYKGRFINELAEDSGKTPINFMMDLLIEDEGQSMVFFFAASEDGLKAVMKKPYCMIASDGIPARDGGHPRMYGSFPRFLSHYVLNQKLIPLEEGIHRITQLPAKVYGLKNRGLLKEGAIADIIVFDPDFLCDHATYNEPNQIADGIIHVLIGGLLLVENGELTINQNGRFVFPIR